MKVKINNMSDLNSNLKYLHPDIVKDIDKRITDWLASGESIEDDYVKQQFRYVENILN